MSMRLRTTDVGQPTGRIDNRLHRLREAALGHVKSAEIAHGQMTDDKEQTTDIRNLPPLSRYLSSLLCCL